jgi:hypothetical protein
MNTIPETFTNGPVSRSFPHPTAAAACSLVSSKQTVTFYNDIPCLTTNRSFLSDGDRDEALNREDGFSGSTMTPSATRGTSLYSLASKLLTKSFSIRISSIFAL